MSNNNLSTWLPVLKGMKPSTINPISQSTSQDIGLLKSVLFHKHMVEFIERFEWDGLPEELTQDLIERILFFRGKGAFFKYGVKHFFLPFALKGQIDSYGRYESINPVLFTGQWSDKKKEINFLPTDVSNVVFEVKYSVNAQPSKHMAIILNDSSLEISQDNIPSSEIIKPILDQLVDILVLVNIDLVSSAKVFYVVAPDTNTKEAIENEFKNLDSQIMNGKRVVVVTSNMELRELQGSKSNKDQQRYMQTYQSFDNLRKDIIGSPNGGTFQKTEHETSKETDLKSSGSSVLNNALRQREEFCELVNKFFGLNLSVKIKENGQNKLLEEEGEQSKQLNGEGDQ